MTFHIGDVAIIKNVTGVQQLLRGRECEILSGLHNIRGIPRHEIEVLGLVLPDGWMVAALPEHLEKLPSPYIKLESWDECPVRPRELA